MLSLQGKPGSWAPEPSQARRTTGSLQTPRASPREVPAGREPGLTHREDGPLLRPLVVVLEETVAVRGRGGVVVIFFLGRDATGRRAAGKGKGARYCGKPRDNGAPASSVISFWKGSDREASTRPLCHIRRRRHTWTSGPRPRHTSWCRRSPGLSQVKVGHTGKGGGCRRPVSLGGG